MAVGVASSTRSMSLKHCHFVNLSHGDVIRQAQWMTSKGHSSPHPSRLRCTTVIHRINREEPGMTATIQTITLQDFHIPLQKAYTANLSNTVKEVVEVMDRHNIDQVPVVDANFDGAMVVTRRGIATVAPIARGVTYVQDVLEEHSNDPSQRLLATTPLTDARQLLVDYDWVLTVDQQGRPIGLATVGDALKVLLKRLGGA